MPSPPPPPPVPYKLTVTVRDSLTGEGRSKTATFSVK